MSKYDNWLTTPPCNEDVEYAESHWRDFIPEAIESLCQDVDTRMEEFTSLLETWFLTEIPHPKTAEQIRWGLEERIEQKAREIAANHYQCLEADRYPAITSWAMNL